MVSLDYLLSPKDDDPPIFARDGEKIPTRKPEIIPEIKMRGLSDEYLKKFPQGNQIRSYSLFPYNCVGMIFASRRKWIDIDHIYYIFAHDGYRQIPKADIVVGDIVLYKKDDIPTHVAVITQIWQVGSEQNVKVLSKWGKLAEYDHFIEHVIVSEVGYPVEYWTERKT